MHQFLISIRRSEGTDIDSADKIKKIGFKISITDENLNEIEKTKTLELNFK